MFKVIQPPTWAGMQKGGPDSPMVCGACPNWKVCAVLDRCKRASDEDYKRGGPYTSLSAPGPPDYPGGDST